MKLFYEHLIIHLNDVYAEIEKLQIDAQDKTELKNLVEDTTHHTVMDTILQHLPKHHHHAFLEKIYHSPQDNSLLDFLKDHVTNVDEKIVASISKLKQKFLHDLSKL